MILKDLPYKLFYRIVDKIKRKYFVVPWGNYPNIILEGKADEVEEWLRRNKHAEGTIQSYHYEGQELELRIPWGLDSEGRQRELHIRGRYIDGDLQLIAHLELSRYEHKEEHINEVGFSWREGTQLLISIMEESPFEIIEVNT